MKLKFRNIRLYTYNIHRYVGASVVVNVNNNDDKKRADNNKKWKINVYLIY